ncbi:hypothetical protein [Photobacterium kishitanii]|nr:hypothetical protein [Photobacterium kishitanii]
MILMLLRITQHQSQWPIELPWQQPDDSEPQPCLPCLPCLP